MHKYLFCFLTQYSQIILLTVATIVVPLESLPFLYIVIIAIQYSFIAQSLIFISRAGSGLIKCDLTDQEAVKNLIEKEKPNFIINAAAERFPDVVENKYEETRLLNINTAGHIAAIARKQKNYIVINFTTFRVKTVV